LNERLERIARVEAFTQPLHTERSRHCCEILMPKKESPFIAAFSLKVNHPYFKTDQQPRNPNLCRMVAKSGLHSNPDKTKNELFQYSQI
jgi:hypothetical protein